MEDVAALAQQADLNQAHAAVLLDTLRQTQHLAKDSAAAVEHFARLLHHKAAECDSLRSIVQAEHRELRRGVAGQQASTFEADTNHQRQVRRMAESIETIAIERQTLERHCRKLRAKVDKLRRHGPRHSAYQGDDYWSELIARRTRRKGGDGDASSSTTSSGSSRSSSSTGNPQSKADLDNPFDAQGSSSRTRRRAMTAKRRERQLLRQTRGAGLGKTFDLNGPFPFSWKPTLSLDGQLVRIANDEQIDIVDVCLGLRPDSVEAAERDARLLTFVRRLLLRFADPAIPVSINERFDVDGDDAFVQHTVRATLAEHLERYGDLPAAGGDPSRPQARRREQAMAESATNSRLLARVYLMLKLHNPKRIGSPELATVLAKYPPAVVLNSLVLKHGPEPDGATHRAILRSIADEGL